MSPLKRSNNIAARMGRWSASHWKTAVFGWLAFVHDHDLGQRIRLRKTLLQDLVGLVRLATVVAIGMQIEMQDAARSTIRRSARPSMTIER